MLSRHFFSSSVSRLSISEKILDDAEDVLDLRPDGGLSIFRFPCLVLTAATEFLQCGWTSANAIPDFPALPVANDGVFTLVRAEITSVPEDFLLVPAQQLWRHRYVGYIP